MQTGSDEERWQRILRRRKPIDRRMSTITIPETIPSPEEDSRRLRKAFQGLGTIEKDIIDVLGHRDASNRVEISRCYSQLYNESLIQGLESALSGDFGRAVISWSEDPSQRDAKLAHEALKYIEDRNIRDIIEIACSFSADYLFDMRQAHCSLFSFSLEEDIVFHRALQRKLKEFLSCLVRSYRYEGDNVDELLTKSEANILFGGIRGEHPFREVFRIIAFRNKGQLKAIFNYYEHEYGISINEDIDCNSCFDNELNSALKVAICCIQSPEKYFAEVIRTSILGLGTDNESLTRAIVTRAEIDMKLIKDEYKKRYDTTLYDDIGAYTSGYYKDFLLALVGNN